ncbi:hypothetical protein DPMN_155939 [Dreissena polymorpha]|uniref:Uncharacterized protein n=1 Tax=Dreissena polymorpha TaxID=45954 RepID=A0A9D4J737_DREPO|nr:hypothetical protein DPMN_155939 [Dreissena polymorpha]
MVCVGGQARHLIYEIRPLNQRLSTESLNGKLEPASGEHPALLVKLSRSSSEAYQGNCKKSTFHE